MQTKIKIPVVYTGYVGRSKITRPVVGSVEHTVAFQELSEAEAPVAFRAVLHDSLFNFVDYRLHDGALYRWACRLKTDGPHQINNRLQSVLAELWKGMSEYVKDIPGSTIPPKARFIPMPKGETFEGMASMLSFETADVRPTETAEDEIAEWRRRADEIAGKNIIVGERMYERSTEPMYRVDMDGPKRVEWANPFSGCPYDDILRRYVHGEIGGRDRLQNWAYFNPDQRDEAQEFLGRLNNGAGNQQPALTIERWLEEYSCRDMHALELDRVARLLLNDVSWGISLRSRNRPILLEDESATMVRALMYLHQTVGTTQDDGIDVGLDDAMQAVVDAAVGGTRTRPVLRSHTRELVSYAIDRWQDRPIASPRMRAIGQSM